MKVRGKVRHKNGRQHIYDGEYLEIFYKLKGFVKQGCVSATIRKFPIDENKEKNVL